jgi:hypothetical protein
MAERAGTKQPVPRDEVLSCPDISKSNDGLWGVMDQNLRRSRSAKYFSYENSCNSALASCRSSVSKPSVNQP